MRGKSNRRIMLHRISLAPSSCQWHVPEYSIFEVLLLFSKQVAEVLLITAKPLLLLDSSVFRFRASVFAGKALSHPALQRFAREVIRYR